MKIKESVFDVDNWIPAKHCQQLAWLSRRTEHEGESSGNSCVWYNDGSLSPLELYCYMKARFGEPNGLGMLGSGTLFQWHYAFLCGDSLIQIMGLPFRTEFWFQNVPNIGDEDWHMLVQLFSSEITRWADAISHVKKSLQRWKLFINPYKRIRNAVDSYSERLKQLGIPEIQLPARPKSNQELLEYAESMKRCWDSYHKAASLGLSIKFLAPVMGEAFINLLFFVLAKSEFKRDKRLYESVTRNAIDVRIRGLHLHCGGFVKQVDASAEQFKNFHALMNKRNEVLHGNVDPKRLMLDELYFDNRIPLMREERPASEFALLNAIKTVEPETVFREIAVIDQFIGFVLQHLRTNVRKQVEAVMETQQLGWNADTQKVGLIMPDEPYEAYAFPVTNQ